MHARFILQGIFVFDCRKFGENEVLANISVISNVQVSITRFGSRT
jgi:hypothetical protein